MPGHLNGQRLGIWGNGLTGRRARCMLGYGNADVSIRGREGFGDGEDLSQPESARVEQRYRDVEF